jgi:predicted outer membrane protein
MKNKFNMLTAAILAVGVSITSFAQQKSSSSTQRKSSYSSSSKSKTAGVSSQGTADQSSADTLFMKRALAIGVAEIEFAQVALQNSNSEKVKNFAQKMIEDHTNANNKLMAIMNGTADEENKTALNAGNKSTNQGMGEGSGTASGMGTGQQNNDSTAAVVSGTSDTTGVTSGGIGSTTGTRRDSASRSAAAGQSTDMDDQADIQPPKPTMELKLSGTYLEMRNKMEGMSGVAFDRQYVQQAQKDHNLSIRLLETYQKEGKHAQIKTWVKEQLPVVRKHKAEAEKLSASVGGVSRSKK